MKVTDRDVKLCLLLFEHRILTTHQIYELHFPSPRRARRRLRILEQAGILWSWRPHRPTGSHPNHYTLGPRGLEIVAGERGVEVRHLGVTLKRLHAQQWSSKREHQIEVNGFFSRLALACRAEHPEAELAEWLSAERCARIWNAFVRPDGLAEVSISARLLGAFVEVDRGTEDLPRLAEKLHGYRRVSGLSNAPDALLFVFPTERREAEARRVLANPGMPLYTSTRERTRRDPLGAIWLQIGDDRRVSLAEISVREPWTGVHEQGVI